MWQNGQVLVVPFFLGLGGLIMIQSAGATPHSITQGFVGRCPKDMRRTVEKCVFNCNGGHDVEEEVDLWPQSEQTVCRMPKGLMNLDVEMVSDGDVDTYVLCVEPCQAGGIDQKEIVDWDSGLIHDRANSIAAPINVSHDGVTYSYGGDDRGTVGGVIEQLNITGATGIPYDLHLHLKNNGLSKNHAWIRYKHDGVNGLDCGLSGWLGCELCSGYTGCSVGNYPVCDGSNEVTCETCDAAPCPFGATCDGTGYVCNGQWIPYLIGVLGLLALLVICRFFCRHGGAEGHTHKSMRAVEMSKSEDPTPMAPAYTYYSVPTAPPTPMASVIFTEPAQTVTTRTYIVENQPQMVPLVRESPSTTSLSTPASSHKPHLGHRALTHGQTTGHGLGMAVPE